jgi:CRISPR type IV-associated protein Csf1
MVNTQKMICSAYGYEDIFPIENIVKTKKAQETIKIVDDNELECSMCGQIHNKGYVSSIDASNLLQSMVSDTYNQCYSLKPTNFICEYCGWSIVSYLSPTKSKFGKKIINSIVDQNGYKEKYFNSDVKNELYSILKNPPEPPFAILINSGGTVIENLVITAKTTISKEWIIVNYGSSNLEVNPAEVFDCLRSANKIANISNTKTKKLKIEPTSDNLFNRQNDIKIKLKKEILEDSELRQYISNFILKYNYDTRLVAKMIQKAFIADKSNETEKEAVSVEAKQKIQSNIFDYLD